MDDKDDKILTLLREHSNLTTSQISKKTNIPITTVHNRIKKLNKGIIKNYTINLDWEKYGKGIGAYIWINVNQKKSSQQEIAKRIKKIEFIESVDIITGDFDLLAKARASTMKELNSLITKNLRNIDGVEKTQTMMILEEI